MVQLSEHFNEQEFLCHCGNCDYSKSVSDKVNPRLLSALEFLREKVGLPIIVVSGVRCARHNKRVGGSTRSFHMSGCAADIQCSKMGLLAMHCMAIGAFRYVELNDHYIHVDVGRVRVQRVRDKRSYRGMISEDEY